jgi:hypothetical protein
MLKTIAISFALLATSIGLMSVASASATVEFNQRQEFDGTTFTCSGEMIAVHGDLHTVSHVTEDASGGSHLGGAVTVFFSGTSSDGARYISDSHQTGEIYLSLDTSAESHTETFHFNLIRLGDGPGDTSDLRTGAVLHFTIDANGHLVADKFEFTVECA